jgi:hypothetical protein
MRQMQNRYLPASARSTDWAGVLRFLASSAGGELSNPAQDGAIAGTDPHRFMGYEGRLERMRVGVARALWPYGGEGGCVQSFYSPVLDAVCKVDDLFRRRKPDRHRHHCSRAIGLLEPDPFQVFVAAVPWLDDRLKATAIQVIQHSYKRGLKLGMHPPIVPHGDQGRRRTPNRRRCRQL